MNLVHYVVSLTMCDGFSATCHDAVAQLNDLWNANDLLGVVALIRQQHQEKKYVGNDGFGISVREEQRALCHF